MVKEVKKLSSYIMKLITSESPGICEIIAFSFLAAASWVRVTGLNVDVKLIVKRYTLNVANLNS